MHTNETQYYRLPQYVGSDIINPLVDTNDAYEKIDTAMHNIAVAAGENATDVADLQTKVGNGAFNTTAQNATDAVNELNGELNDAGTGVKDRVVSVENEVDTLQNQMVTAQGNIVDLQNNKASQNDVTAVANEVSTLNTEVGTDTLKTVAQTLKGAINEVFDKTEGAKHFLFVGDSFGDSTGRGYDCWPEFFAQSLGLTNSDFNNLCKDGAGIYGNNQPQYMFLTQLQNYSGDKTKVTDIIIGEALNDSYSDNPADSIYTTVKSYFADLVAYVKANYPNATLYIGSIGNANDTSSIITTRTYRARQTFRELLFNWCAEYNVHILNGVEYAIVGHATWFTSDLAHPNVTGEKYLGYAMARAYVSDNANICYFYKNGYTLSNAIFSSVAGTVEITIQNNILRVSVDGVVIEVTEGESLGQDFVLATSDDIWFNKQTWTNGNIRLHEFNGESEQVIPCSLRFTNNVILVHIPQYTTQWITSWTAGTGAYFSFDGFDLTVNSDITA